MTTAPATTDATDSSSGASESGSASNSGSTSGSGSMSSSGAEASTGDPAAVCDTCDTATELCFESIVDGPSEFSCRPIPTECAADITCDCIVPLECPESLQSCALEGELVVVECVEG